MLRGISLNATAAAGGGVQTICIFRGDDVSAEIALIAGGSRLDLSYSPWVVSAIVWFLMRENINASLGWMLQGA